MSLPRFLTVFVWFCYFLPSVCLYMELHGFLCHPKTQGQLAPAGRFHNYAYFQVKSIFIDTYYKIDMFLMLSLFASDMYISNMSFTIFIILQYNNRGLLVVLQSSLKGGLFRVCGLRICLYFH